MSIKKIPVCPFCKSEMKLEGSGSAKIPYELKDVTIETHYVRTIANHFSFETYICPSCGFVALWRYQLQ